MKKLIWVALASLALAGCDGSGKSSIWGDEPGVTPESTKSCEVYGNCDKGDE